MVQWLLLLVIIQNSIFTEIRGSEDAVNTLSTETSAQSQNTGGSKVEITSELQSSDALKSAIDQPANLHTITSSDFAKKTAAVTEERSAVQKARGDGTTLNIVDQLHPIVQPQHEQPLPNLPQEALSSSSVAQVNPVSVENVATPQKSVQPVLPSNSANTDSGKQQGGSSQVASNVNQPSSAVSQSSEQGNAKTTATDSQPQQTPNISPGADSPPEKLQKPTILQENNSPQSMIGSSKGESSEQQNLQQPAIPTKLETPPSPVEVTKSTASTMTVVEVTPRTHTNEQLTSGDSSQGPSHDNILPANSATQKVEASNNKEASNLKEQKETDVSSDSSPANNKEANAVKTEDKGGGGVGGDIDAIILDITPLHSFEEIRQCSLFDLSNKISHEIKQYRDNVSSSWESERLVSWTVEATSYLKVYMDAISITKSAHNSACVENDLKNYDIREKTVQDIIESCKKEAKRDNWHILEEKTKNVLQSFDKVVQNASNIISMLNKDSEIFQVVKTAVEDYAKNSLCLIDTRALRKSFSELKVLTLKTDKEEYQKCIDSKPEQSMIKETMSDIMRIKNNCVG